MQRYSTDGKTSVSTGTDGDEFHTSAVWGGHQLVLSVEEHERGHVLLSRKRWMLIEGGSALEVDRENLDPAANVKSKQKLIYVRQLPDTAVDAASDGPR